MFYLKIFRLKKSYVAFFLMQYFLTEWMDKKHYILMVAPKKELKTGIKAKKKIAHAHLSKCTTI